MAHLYKESELKIESRLDPLTKIHNRRGFEEAFIQFQKLGNRLNRAAQLLFIDLNNFKKINDTLGHKAGDEVLKRFANILRSCIRNTDLLCRWGGDEFVILLNNEDKVAQKEFIERIKEKQENDFNNYGYQEICFSVGAVEVVPNINCDLVQLLHKADSIMYSCKKVNR